MRSGSVVGKALSFVSIVGVLACTAQVSATALDNLSSTETASGLKAALSKGAAIAVAQLGKPNGFLGDARVRIPLPESARAAEQMMRTFGMKKQADELIATMNRAAEMAVLAGRPATHILWATGGGLLPEADFAALLAAAEGQA